MKFENGELISEIYPQGHPANYGNSMAESSRYLHLCIHLYTEAARPANVDLRLFRTDTTYIQSASPNCPKDWLVSTDQCLPWDLVMSSREMSDRIKSWGWRTPDGNLISPIFYAVLTRNKFLLNLFIGLQALIFKLPWRWDDGLRKFTSTSGSSADYLNWFHCALYCNKWVKSLVSKETLKSKIKSYYQPKLKTQAQLDAGEEQVKQEPNSDWLIKLYNEVIDTRY